jgi:hypothetical protein
MKTLGRFVFALTAAATLITSALAQGIEPFTLHDKPWRGVPSAPAKVTDIVHPGGANFSLRWDAGKPGVNNIGFKFTERDFSAYDTLSFWVYAEKATFATITVFINSPNGHDYDGYRTDFSVEEEKKWVKYSLPLDRFSKNRDAAGWEHITSVNLLASWGDSAPVEGTVIYLTDMQFELSK